MAYQDDTEMIAKLIAERDAATAERARYGDMMTARLGDCENERDAARAEAAELREKLETVMRYVNGANELHAITFRE